MKESRFFVRGDIDVATRAQLAADLAAAMSANDNTLVVDCFDLACIECAGLAVFVTTYETCRAEGRGFRIENPAPILCRVLDLLGLNEMLRASGIRTSD